MYLVFDEWKCCVRHSGIIIIVWNMGSIPISWRLPKPLRVSAALGNNYFRFFIRLCGFIYLQNYYGTTGHHKMFFCRLDKSRL